MKKRGRKGEIKAQEKKNTNILSSDVVTYFGRDNGDVGVIMTFVSIVSKFFMTLQLLTLPDQDHNIRMGGIKYI